MLLFCAKLSRKNGFDGYLHPTGTAANIKGSVTRSRDNYLENRRDVDYFFLKIKAAFPGKMR